MAELKMPVRVLQSGKVYRQMFDAEVQLMKSIEASKVKSLQVTDSFRLPPVDGDKLEHQPSVREGTESHLTAANILTERQRNWTGGMPNDSVTENPVVYRQLTTEAVARTQEKETDIEAREVRGLPNVIQVVKRDSDIVQRIAEKRRIRHENVMEEMHRDLCVISNRVEPRLTSIGENIQNQLKEDDNEIQSLFSEIESDDDLVNFAYDQLENFWLRVEAHSGVRRIWIGNASEWLNQVEDERLDAISSVLRKYTSALEKVASLPKSDIHRLIEKEAMMINQSILANRRAYAKLETNLLECDIEREMSQHMTWTERVKDWRKLNAEIAVQQFTDFMSSEEILEPPDVKEVTDALLNEQKNLAEQRREILEQLMELKPPSSTKPSVYKWNTALSKANEDLDKLHIRLVRVLHEKYETTCQLCLSEIEKYKQNLLLSNVCDEDDMRRIVNDHLLPMVGSRLRTFEKKLEEMDQVLEELASRTERQLTRIFKFAQGAAHLWDVHEIGLARQERMLENELENARHEHDTDNQERESKLDILLDRLRQESTDEALSDCLDQCLEMLAHIKLGYREFHHLQMNKTSVYPAMVGDELKKYDESVCKFFKVGRRKTNDAKKTKKPRKRPRKAKVRKPEDGKERPPVIPKRKRIDGESDESELDKMFRDILTTDKGTTFCVLTSAETNDFEDSGAPPSDEEIVATTFLTEIEGPEELDKLPHYVQNVYLDSNYVRNLNKTVRLNFLNHLEQWKEKAVKNAESTARSKQEELLSELDLRLHLHAPRCKRIEVDVRNVRAAELILHRERVTRHCRGITAALATIKHEFGEMTKEHDNDSANFKARVEGMEDVFLNANKSTKLVELMNNLHKDLGSYVEDTKWSLRNFRQRLDATLGRLRTSNAQCVRAFKLFSEGGNFSPDETTPLRKKLEKMSQKVDAAEGLVMKDLEGMESRRLDQATDIVGKFEDRFKSHMVDLSFIEKMKRWLTNAQVRIKTEVAHSNGMAVEVASHLSALKRRVDACEKPNIDKESVTPDLLRTYVDEVMECLHKRAVYLNCKKQAPMLSIDVKSDPVTQDRQSPAPPPSAGPAPKTTASKRRDSARKTASRQGVDTQGSTYSKGGRQPTDDSAIGVIKNILRAQKSGFDPEDARSIMTGTTRAPPSTSNSQLGPSKHPNRLQRQGTLASIAGSNSGESDVEKKTPMDGVLSGVYRRRETKFDAKFMIFGVKPMEGTHFLAKSHQILFEALDGMLSTAEIYYKQKGSRALTRPNLIQDNFDQCGEKVVEKLGNFEKQTNAFHNNSLQDFRKLLRDLEEEMCNVPRLVLSDLLRQELDVLDGGQEQLREEFRSKEQVWEVQKKSHKQDLRPTLGHPDQEPALLELSEQENARQERHVTGIAEQAKARVSNVRECSSRFAGKIASCSAQLLRQYDNLLTIDDVIVGRVPPKKELTSVLIRRRGTGVAMGDVADPRFGEKPIVERGPRQWKPLDFSILDLLPSDDTVVGNDPTNTSATTLPHTTVASIREEVLRRYRDAHVEATRDIRDTENVALQAERRWKANWSDSIRHVKKLYK